MRPRRTALSLAILVAFAGCAGDPAPTAPGSTASVAALPDPSSDLWRVRRQLERAADGLLYTSESDHPFTFLDVGASIAEPLTVAGFRTAAAIPADSVVEQVSLDAFLARHIEDVDPADAAAVALVPRYERLRATLQRELAGATVFRVGRILIRCHLVGTTRGGRIAGLTTWAVET